MSGKALEEKIDPDFTLQCIKVLENEKVYLENKRLFLINLKRNLNKKGSEKVIEVIKLIGGKPHKSLCVIMDCKSEELPKKQIGQEEDLGPILHMILSNCIKGYTKKLKYIEGEIGAYLPDENNKK